MKKTSKKVISILLALFIIPMSLFALAGAATDIDAEYVSDTIPTTMQRGETYQISITMKNVGAVHHWQQAYNIRLGNLVWEEKFDNYIEWTEGSLDEGMRVYLSTDTDTTPIQIGETYTFTFSVKAPETGDSVVFAARMVQDGAYWLGDEIVKTITLTDEEVSVAPTASPTTAPVVETPGDSFSFAAILVLMISFAAVLLVGKKSILQK